MPEEHPPVDPDQPGSPWSWSSSESDQDTGPRPVTPAADAAEPEAPQDAHAGDGTTTARRALPRGEDFRRTVGFTVLGTVVPGVGLIAAGRRVVGSVVLALFVLTLAAIGIAAAVDRDALLAVGVDPTSLRRLSIVLVVVAALWVVVVVATHLALRRRPTRPQRIVGGVLVGVLAFAVAAPMAVAARTAYVQAGLVGTLFKSSGQTKSATRPTDEPGAPHPGDKEKQADPWADKARLNILLLGGDAGKGRVGTRTDTVILASIDTKTGDTTLFSLPRNTARMPFPSDSPLRKYYPNGFTDGDPNNAEFFLNAMYRDVPARVPKNILGDTDNLGADVMKLSVGQALGLKVDYYTLINLQGFATMIDALGGIRLNINTYIPIGGNTDLHIPPKEYLHPGANQKLDGRSALWYARGRYGSDDFARMDRQRCVINAMIKQVNPTTLLTRYEDIANASKSIVYTDIPQEVLPAMLDLSLRVKKGNVRSIVFKNGVNGFSSADPDFSRMRSRVKKAIGESKSDNTPAKTTSSDGSGGAPTSEDVNTTCKYDPKVAATAKPYTG